MIEINYDNYIESKKLFEIQDETTRTRIFIKILVRVITPTQDFFIKKILCDRNN
jgi:hypothetical protein